MKTLQSLIFLLATLLLPASTYADNSIPKATWSQDLVNNLPGILCQQNQVFLRCYQTSAQGCYKVMKIVTDACIKNLPGIPATLSLQDSNRWGAEVGKCAALAYDIAMANAGNKKPASACQ